MLILQRIFIQRSRRIFTNNASFFIIKAENFRDTTKVICNKLFVEKRLIALGMLKCTIAQVTDVVILNTSYTQFKR